MIFVEREPGTVLLDCLFTRPEWRGDGLASTLLSLGLPKLLESSIHTIQSNVFEGNTASCAWHEHTGFVAEMDLLRIHSMVHRLRRERHRLGLLGRSMVEINTRLEAMQMLEVQLEAHQQ